MFESKDRLKENITTLKQFGFTNEELKRQLFIKRRLEARKRFEYIIDDLIKEDLKPNKVYAELFGVSASAIASDMNRLKHTARTLLRNKLSAAERDYHEIHRHVLDYAERRRSEKEDPMNISQKQFKNEIKMLKEFGYTDEELRKELRIKRKEERTRRSERLINDAINDQLMTHRTYAELFGVTHSTIQGDLRLIKRTAHYLVRYYQRNGERFYHKTTEENGFLPFRLLYG